MKIFLIITGLIFVIIGLRALVKPVAAVADIFSLKIEGTDGFSYLRASAGGVTVFAGLVMMAVLYSDWLVTPGLVMVTTILGGLVFGRIVSLIMDGKPTGMIWFSAGFEIFGLLQAVFWMWVDYQSRLPG